MKMSIGFATLVVVLVSACDQTPVVGPPGPDAPLSPSPDALVGPPPGLPLESQDGHPSPALTSGENLLATSFTHTGNVGFAIDVIPFTFSPVPSTFTISGLPGGSTVLQALMYVQRWDAPITSASAVLSGNPLGPIAAFAVDPAGGFQLQSYRFDVTTIVTGNGSFPFTFTTSGGQNYYAALAVVFSNPSLSPRTIVINDGSEAIGSGSSTTTYGGVGAGSGTLTIVTQADDSGGSGESIVFNGSTIVGPGNIFNANLGNFASLHQPSVTVVAGANTASITTSGGDLFGWHLAILDAPAPFIEVDIDIKPGSDPNSINPKSKGVIPVAIQGSATFNVSDVDVTTLKFGPNGATPAHDLTDPVTYADHLQDVNTDGETDLVSHYRTPATGIASGDNEACLTGKTTGDVDIEGCDSVRTVGKN